jgi:hypothetical protein
VATAAGIVSDAKLALVNVASRSASSPLRLHNDYDAIVDAACKAWNRLLAETGRITSLCSGATLQQWAPATLHLPSLPKPG